VKVVAVLTNPEDVWQLFKLDDVQTEVGTRFEHEGVTYETVTRPKAFVLTVNGMSFNAGGIFPQHYPAGAVAAKPVAQ
jgi:hypothetical protein